MTPPMNGAVSVHVKFSKLNSVDYEPQSIDDHAILPIENRILCLRRRISRVGRCAELHYCNIFFMRCDFFSEEYCSMCDMIMMKRVLQSTIVTFIVTELFSMAPNL